MIDWILAGALTAMLMAEAVDAWALRRLTQTCLAHRARTESERRLLRWHAEGFDHSIAVTRWLRAGCLLLAMIALAGSAHPLMILAALLLALCAHGEQHFSARLRRRFLQTQGLRLR